MMKRKPLSSRERSLTYLTAMILTAYLYLTAKSFQHLPEIPSLQEMLDDHRGGIGKEVRLQAGADALRGSGNGSGRTGDALKGLLSSSSSASSAGDAGNAGNDGNASLEQLIADQSPFPKSINFGAPLQQKQNQNQNQNQKQPQPSKNIDGTEFDHDQLEEITHPAVELLPSLANQIDKLIVPKFYNPPIFQKYGGIRSYLGNYGDRLMTLQEAKSIGSFVEVDDLQHSHGKEPEPKAKLETIYVAIASYRDFQCPQTIESILTRARYPQRVRIAVVDQLDFNSDNPCSQPQVPCADNPHQTLCKYKSQIDFYEMDASFAVGPVFARHLGHRMYRGEYFAMQCDAHVDFIKHWDTTIIDAWRSANNEMAVMTTYLSDVHGAMDDEGNLKTFSRPIMCKSDYEGRGETKHLRHGQQPEGVTMIKGEPTFEPFWAAGFSFSRGHFVINVPYDQHLPWVFQGEEISIGLRGFTYGYDYYAPEHSVCFHYYASQDKTGKRDRVNLFWEHSNIFTQKGNVVEKKGMKRLNGILNMNPSYIKEDEWIHDDEQYFGLGKVRTTQKFFDTFGIDTKRQRTQNHLCKFVGRNMQKKWKPHLRKDTMGINYDEIDYKFKDPDLFGATW